jgi:hypothetical protein
MRAIIFAVGLMSFSGASAQVQPEDIFGGILDLIQDQINKDDQDTDSYVGQGVLLKDLGDRLVLGRVTLQPKGGVDSFNLPKCKQSNNQPVSALRFRVKGADAFVRRVRIGYQNGDVEVVDVQQTFTKESGSDWYSISNKGRCVDSITVRGYAETPAFGFGPGGQGGFNGWKKPGKPGKPIFMVKPSVLTFVGLKAKQKGGF